MSLLKEHFSRQPVKLDIKDYYKVYNAWESKPESERESIFFYPDNCTVYSYFKYKTYYLNSFKSYLLLSEATKEYEFKYAKKKKIDSLIYEKINLISITEYSWYEWLC